MNEKFYSDQLLIQSDESQWRAYNSKASTVVIAGPGSGKTRVLTLKAIKLLKSDINRPSGLACISYSRETVRELKKRLKEYGYQASNNDFIGTMHGFCLMHVLQPFAHLFPQYNIPLPLKIASNEVSDQIYEGILAQLSITDKVLSLNNLKRQRSLSFIGNSEVVIESNDIDVRAAKLYEEKLVESGHVDFISMINISTLMIREQDYIKQSLEAKFPWLLIDEYQDLGKPLHEMALELEASTEIKIFAVGDMNQSIYGFAGAYPDFLKELDDKDDFKSIHLTSNYRSNQDIIEGSLDVLKVNPPRPEYLAKRRINEKAEFTFIVCEAEMNQQYEVVAKHVIPQITKKGISHSEIGILVDSSKSVVQMATTLQDHNIPFYIVKWSFNNTVIVVWLQECAKWCLDDKLQSFDELFRFWQALLKVHEHELATWENIRQRVFLHSILLESKSKITVFEWLQFVLSKLDLKELLNNSENHPDENQNLKDLMDEAQNKNLKDASLRRFAHLGNPEEEVTVTTRHSAKGLEFEAVIMLGMVEGYFPFYKIKDNSRQMEEAHRLCYVSVSRAKRECFLIRSKKHTTPWGITKSYMPSRFWNLLHEKFGNKDNTLYFNSYLL